MSKDAVEVFLQALRMDFSAQVLVFHAHQTWSSGAGVQRSSGVGGEHTSLPANTRPPTIVGAFVTESFAAELYLKSMYSIDGVAFPKKHLLDVLFGGLPQAWTQRIETHYARHISRDTFAPVRRLPEFPETAAKCLEQAANAFQAWRYVFDYDQPSTFLGAGRMALIDAILEVKPEWDRLRQDLDTPPTSRSR